jgi:uncharacterized repeat protein (TIGR01451 family)
LFGALLLGLVSQSALAAGTASTTVVTSLGNITYDVGGTPLTVCSAPGAGNSTLDDDGTCVTGAFGALVTDFAVDNKVDVLVTEGNTTYTTTVAGTLNALTTFTVENQGNTTQDFSLAVANLANGTVLFTLTDDFNPTGCTVDSVTISSGSMGVYTAGDQHINALTADSIATVNVSCDIPAAQADGSFAVVSLTATGRADDAANTLGGALAEAANTEDGVEIVFGDSAGTDDALGDAAHSDRDAYLVQAATLTITKSLATLCDPVDGNAGPHNIPGGMVRWTITITNSGGASANLTTFSDAIPTNTTFDPDLIDGVGAGTLCEFAAAGAGTPESANGSGVRLQNSVARPMSGTPGGTVTSSYFTGAADADGVTVAASVAVDFTTAFPAGGGYTAGELKAGETVTVYFNVGIQ